jgi:hypothetical protein
VRGPGRREPVGEHSEPVRGQRGEQIDAGREVAARRSVRHPRATGDLADGDIAGTCRIEDVPRLTADYLSRGSYPIAPGDRVVIHAAAGGVGPLLAPRTP